MKPGALAPFAKTLLAQFQTLSAILAATAEGLVKVDGVGEPGADF